MPVTDKKGIYKEYEGKWTKCKTVMDGEEAVKKAGTAYLPKLSSQSDTEYNAYKKRALFYGATGRTRQGLMGALFRKEVNFPDISESNKKELEQVTEERRSAEYLARVVGHHFLTNGRLGVLVDAAPIKAEGESPRVYITTYAAKDAINWEVEETAEGFELSLVVLKESYEKDGDDKFTKETKVQFRVLELQNGVYVQEIWREGETDGKTQEGNWDVHETITPKKNGKTLDKIPFFFANSTGISNEIIDPPLLPIANVNLSHYRSSADLEHGRHFTGLPTAWAAGFEVSDDLYIGSSKAWITDDAEASCGYLEFTGQGLKSLENALKEKQEMMAVLGARILEESKKGVEAADSQEVRRRSENNVLVNISVAIEEVLELSLGILFDWRGTVSEEIKAEVNKDFIDNKLGADDIKALMESWQGLAISWDTLFWNYKKGEMYPDDITKEEELARISNPAFNGAIPIKDDEPDPDPEKKDEESVDLDK